MNRPKLAPDQIPMQAQGGGGGGQNKANYNHMVQVTTRLSKLQPEVQN